MHVQYSKDFSIGANRIAQFVRERAKQCVTIEDKQKVIKEVSAKFKEKLGAEQLAENIKLHHGIKK